MGRSRLDQTREIQLRILNAVECFQALHGFSPSIRNICDAVGIKSTSHVKYHLQKLEADGRLKRDARRPRAIQMVNQVPTLHFQIQGRIRAGLPVPIPDFSNLPLFDEESAIDVPCNQLPKNTDNLYALEVEGDSMIDAMVGDGDVVILQKVSQVSSGQMVAAWIESKGESTLKRIYYENGKVRLQPANPAYPPIILDPADVSVQGLVIKVIRTPNRIL